MSPLLFSAFSFDKFAVETGNIAQRYVLGALSGASTGIGAVAEAKFIHLAHHGAGTALTLYLTLGEECELANLSRYEEHGRAVLAGSHTCATSDAGCRVHGSVGYFLADGEVVGILGTTAVERYVATGLLDLIEGVTVNHKVADYREGSRAPGFDGDGVAIVELTHVELAGSDALYGAVGVTIDIERAHAADTFTAVAVEDYRFVAALNKLLVEHIEHFEEAAAGRHIVERIVDELSFLFRTTLTPNFQFYADSMFHFTI